MNKKSWMILVMGLGLLSSAFATNASWCDLVANYNFPLLMEKQNCSLKLTNHESYVITCPYMTFGGRVVNFTCSNEMLNFSFNLQDFAVSQSPLSSRINGVMTLPGGAVINPSATTDYYWTNPGTGVLHNFKLIGDTQPCFKGLP